MEYLKISDVDLSGYIQKMSISHEPVWNTNAGRTLTADFVGRIVARKWKLQFTTRPLSQNEIQMITNLLEKADFFDVEFIPTNATTPITKTFYVNAPTAEIYSYADSLAGVRYKQLAFNIIEQ